MNERSYTCQKTWIKISDCQDLAYSGNAIGLTFDFDWACDEVLLDTVDIVERYGVPATWFVTHSTPLLERLRANPNFELGIHPNFNAFLEGKNMCQIGTVIDDLLSIVPEAKCVRSHSMLQSSNLMELFLIKGLVYDCNHFVPEQSMIELCAWKLWNGLIKVPHFWEDDAVCIYEKNTPIDELFKRKGLKIFDFHPIHVFLNTEHLDRYERTRDLHYSPNKLIKHRYEDYGTRSRLLELLEAAKDA